MLKAQEVVRRFGGPNKVSEKLGLSQSAVSMWEYVPGKWHIAFLAWGRKEGIELTEEDLSDAGQRLFTTSLGKSNTDTANTPSNVVVTGG